ncbi:sigma-70 family RNA polymerase sigma factor, partial [Streptomyces sp. T-3]|nr:sigma-70 family RNA polymerase sigma factor [Streptomyces sp. T-3]
GPGHEEEVPTAVAVRALLRTVPPAQRAVLVLRFCHQLTEREIADVLDCSRGTVMVWYPTAEVQLPPPGRHLLLLKLSERPDRAGDKLYDLAPELAPPVTEGGRVTLKCQEGKEGSASLDRLQEKLS